jgi:hypothetical protein
MRDWNELLQDRLIKREQASIKEIATKIDGARHSVQQAGIEGLDHDTRFDLYYDAVYRWCEIVLRAEGWRSVGMGHHETVLSGLQHFLGEEAGDLADYFDRCRRIRHDIHYDWEPGLVGPVEVAEISENAEKLEVLVLTWLRKKHPQLLPDE